MYPKKVIYLTLALILLAATGSALRIHTLETGQDEYQPEQEVDITGFVINDEGEPIADHQVELAIAYSPIYNPERAESETIRHRVFLPLEMNADENRYVNHSWTVPENAPPGSYKIYFRILNANEDLQVFNTERFNVTDTGQEVRAAAIDDLFFHQGDSIGYDLEGLRVSSNESANATMNVSNLGTVDLTLNMTMDMQYTFDSTRSAFEQYEQVTVPAGETRTVVFEFMPPEDPTTYTPVFQAYDSEGTFLGEKKGRLVVRGESGRILRAGIDNNAYRSGDMINITADLIGPADYSGTIPGATFNYTIEDENGILAQGRETVDIGGQITELRFQEEAPRSFANPNVTMVLSKDGNVYDRYTASYSGGEVPSGGFPVRTVLGVVIVLIAAGLLVWRWKQ